MEQQYRWSWVEARVEESIEVWNDCAAHSLPASPRYTVKEQRKREEAYDKALGAVQREAGRAARTTSENGSRKSALWCSFLASLLLHLVLKASASVCSPTVF